MLLGPLGGPEIIAIVVLLIVIFGAKRLPQLGAGLGEGISNFKRSLSGQDKKDENTIQDGNNEEPQPKNAAS
jgi:sec-independent protein translocase protein TatA